MEFKFVINCFTGGIVYINWQAYFDVCNMCGRGLSAKTKISHDINHWWDYL